MLAISSHGSICARCALRRRILTLQKLRQKSDHRSHRTLRFNKSRPKNPFDEGYDNETAQVLRKLNEGFPSHPQNPKKEDTPISFYLTETGLEHPNKGTWGARKIDADGPVRKFIGRNLSDWGLDKTSMNRKREQGFKEALMKRLNVVKMEVKDAPMLEEIAKDVREMDGKEQSFNRLWRQFTQKILRGDGNQADHLGGMMEDFEKEKGKSGQEGAIWEDLSSAYRTRGVSGLEDRIKYAFYGHVNDSRFTESDVKNQKTLADLRYPTEWYPATRSIQRKIHLHVGPTNSGKTYHALQRLEQADKGVYAGPLRLLAHEVYTRLNAKGKPCALITGEERRAAENQEEDADMSACTVEMMPLNKTLDVAVIDEIQMIGSSDRGWAWTQALLGVKAKEVHLCGEERTVPLLRELCASIGEELEIHRYQRLSPLQMAERSMDGKLKGLRKGDCIVSFTVMGIHALRREIEKSTGRKVAIVYGSLPPETRAQQARLFNDPNNDYDFLVASDAVGMGLNLAIKRIIFETATKFDGIARRTLSVADIKQIGGRAGRFRIAEQATEAPASEQDLAAAKGEPDPDSVEEDATPDSVGLVTTLERFDFPIVKEAMESDPEPIQSAGIFPPAPVLERFASYFPPRTPFSYILTRLHDISQMHKRFHLCGLKDQVWVADLIEPVEGLTVADRNTICSCPCSKSDNDLWKDLMPAFARCIAEQSGGSIVDIKELPLETLEAEVVASREYLRELERLHKGIVAYLWLSYRFAGIFNTRSLAFRVKSLVEEKIEHVLGKFSFSEAQRRRLAERREKEILEGLMIGSEDQADESAPRSGEAAAESGETEADAREKKITEAMAQLSGEEETSSTNDGPQYEGAEPGAQLEGESPPSDSELVPEDRSLTAGGDRFGGEEETTLEEPEMEEVMREKQPDAKPTSDETLDAKEQTTLPDDRPVSPESFNNTSEPASSPLEQAEQNAEDGEPKKATAGGM